MDLFTKENLVLVAIDEAKKALQQGNSPFGAVLSDLNGKVIEIAHNTVNTDMDPTAHAEINLIRTVSKKLNSNNLSNFCLISNVQSCPMCFSAAVRSKITNFVYGCSEDETLVPNINVFQLSEFCKNKLNIETGILNDVCKQQLKQARETI